MPFMISLTLNTICNAIKTNAQIGLLPILSPCCKLFGQGKTKPLTLKGILNEPIDYIYIYIYIHTHTHIEEENQIVIEAYF